ncbi:hypothetical protein Avbf_01482 [Armadillidium vulgare]|nr:hypothetical protein Avbf_01482 [Armadillidium vulgare]
MELIVIEEDSNFVHCVVILRKKGISFKDFFNIERFSNLKRITNDDSVLSCKEESAKRKIYNGFTLERVIQIKCLWFPVLLKELESSSLYRQLFIRNFKNVSKLKHYKNNLELFVRLDCQIWQTLDYSWEYRCSYLLQERSHLDSVMSWLSTLGGAFSALGDFDPAFAERASVTSYKQMLIACHLGDLNLIARCWLYCSLALIQKKKFKKASRVIQYVFNWAKQESEGKVDHRIFNMCYGIWAKLKYEHALHHSFEKKNALLHSKAQ